MPGHAAVVLGAALGFVGVALGAFGAHALEGRVGPEALAAWETGTRYLLLHAPAAVAAGLLAARRARPAWSAVAFLVGSAVFAGTLCGMALGGPRILGAVTPVGGLGLLAGWLLLAVEGRRSASPPA